MSEANNTGNSAENNAENSAGAKPIYSSEGFKAMNGNNDNFVTQEEIVTFYKKSTQGMLPENVGKAAAEAIMTGGDLNGDKKLSSGEFAWYVNNNQEIKKQEFEKTFGTKDTNKLFTEYDKDKNGIITEEEIKTRDKELEANNKVKDESKGLSTGAIIGIVVGAVCLIGLIVGIVYMLTRDKKKDQGEAQENSGNNYDHDPKKIDYSADKSLNTVNSQKQDKGIA